MKNIVSIATTISLLFSTSQGYTYNRSTHQHITELAYGLIKYAEYCQPEPVTQTLIDTCRMQCIGNVKISGPGDTLEAAEGRCKDACITKGTESQIFQSPNLAQGDAQGAKDFCGNFKDIIRIYKTPSNKSKLKSYTEKLQKFILLSNFQIKGLEGFDSTEVKLSGEVEAAQRGPMTYALPASLEEWTPLLAGSTPPRVVLSANNYSEGIFVQISCRVERFLPLE